MNDELTPLVVSSLAMLLVYASVIGLALLLT